jgi:glutamyl-tRNA reductase
MRFQITGLNHRTAPVEVRERLAFGPDSLAAALDRIRDSPGFQEGVILSTCNRVEVAVTLDESPNGTSPEATLEQFLSESCKVPAEQFRAHLYHYEGRDAIRHLFRVAASLDSMVVGEPQILGQLKDAYQAAKTQGSCSQFLDAVMTRAFSVAKRVRSETEIGQNAVSVSYAAVELAREIFGGLKNKTVLLVGAGKMSELAARHLKRAGASRILVTNRTHERAVEMARLFDGSILEYDRFHERLVEVDIVIASSGAPHYILTRDSMSKVLKDRKNRPVFLIDIAVPRNIEPAVNDLDNVFLYDIDDLGRVVDQNRQERQVHAQQAEEIIDEEVERMLSRLRAREATPMIVSLQEQLEQVRLGEIERMRGKLGPLTTQQEEAIEALTRGIVNKIAHAPIAEIRRHAGSEHGHHILDVIRRVFRL